MKYNLCKKGYNPITEADFKAVSNKILSIEITKDLYILNISDKFTTKEEEELSVMANSKKINLKNDYSNLTTDTQRIEFFAKRFGLN